MKLYLLKRFTHIDYDEISVFAVRADSEERARYLAGNEAADEGKETWLDKNKSSCEEIKTEGKEEIITFSFNAG